VGALLSQIVNNTVAGDTPPSTAQKKRPTVSGYGSTSYAQAVKSLLKLSTTDGGYSDKNIMVDRLGKLTASVGSEIDSLPKGGLSHDTFLSKGVAHVNEQAKECLPGIITRLSPWEGPSL
jgi:hypothetical protein